MGMSLTSAVAASRDTYLEVAENIMFHCSLASQVLQLHKESLAVNEVNFETVLQVTIPFKQDQKNT